MLLVCEHIRPLSSTSSSFVKWHSAVHGFFVYNGDYINESMSEFNLLQCSHFLNSSELLENRKKATLIFMVIVFTINCKNHRCQCKQMHGKYFRITTALCHLTVVLVYAIFYFSFITYARNDHVRLFVCLFVRSRNVRVHYTSDFRNVCTHTCSYICSKFTIYFLKVRVKVQTAVLIISRS